MTVADTIREARLKTGLNRREFSEKYNIPESTIVCWERGERTPPEYVVELLLRCMMIDFPVEQSEKQLSKPKPTAEKNPSPKFYDIFGKPLSPSDIDTVYKELESNGVEILSTTPQKDGTIRRRCKIINNGFLFNIFTTKWIYK